MSRPESSRVVLGDVPSWRPVPVPLGTGRLGGRVGSAEMAVVLSRRPS